MALELLPGARLRVRRELEGGLIELREVDLPAGVTVQTGINEPRYVMFRADKQADQKELAGEARVPEVHAWVAHLGLRLATTTPRC